MIKANHPKAGFFSEYIYKLDGADGNNNFDIILRSCNGKSEEGFFCEGCYKSALRDKLSLNPSYLWLKKFLAYQIALYEDSAKWIKELNRAIEYDLDFKLYYELERLIDEVIEEIVESEAPQADLSNFVTVTNIFEGATINQLNMGDGSQNITYNNILDQMLEDGVPSEIVEEGRELLKDADKSDSIRKVAGNWIKSIPFKVIEKAGEWALKNPDKLATYQDSLMQLISNS